MRVYRPTTGFPLDWIRFCTAGCLCGCISQYLLVSLVALLYCISLLLLCRCHGLYVSFSHYLYACPYFCMCVSLSVSLSIYPSIHACIHPSVRPSIHPSIHPSIQASIYPSVI